MFRGTAVLHESRKRHVEQAGTDAEQYQERTGGNIAEGEFLAGVNKLAFDRIEQERKQREAAGTKRQNAEFDFSTGPEAGEDAAETDADDQRAEQRRDL